MASFDEPSEFEKNFQDSVGRLLELVVDAIQANKGLHESSQLGKRSGDLDELESRLRDEISKW